MNSYLTLVIGIMTCVILGSASGCEASMKAAEPVKEETVTAVSNQENQAFAEEDSKPTLVEMNSKVRISTAMGDMVVELYDETPGHRDNFIKLAEEGFYNDLLFHRVMNKFMIQGGDPNSRNAAPTDRLGSTGPGYTVPADIKDEFVHVKGALAAARKPNSVNPKMESSGSQFYIVHGKPITVAELMSVEARRNAGKDSSIHFHYTDEQVQAYLEHGGYPFLDGEYTVFGMLVEGFETLDIIAAVPTAQGNRPAEDVKMTVEVIK